MVCTGFASICSLALGVQRTRPTIRELLDLYRQKMDKLNSYICKTETVYLGNTITLAGGTKIANEAVAPSTVEMRTDGDRFYICERDPTGLARPKEILIPNDLRSRTWLWDGKYYYFYGQLTEQYARKYAEKYIDGQLRERYLKRAIGNVTIYVDVEKPGTKRMITRRRPNLPDYSRVFYLLNDAPKSRILDETETVGGSQCYVIEMETGPFSSKLWTDPTHGYLIAKRIDWTDGRKYYEEWNVSFKRFDDIWFRAEMNFQYFDSGGRWSEDEHRYRLVEFVLNPDHDKLKSFEPDFVEGADVRLFGVEGIEQRQHFTWGDGKILDTEKKQIRLDDIPRLAPLTGRLLPSLGKVGLVSEKVQEQNRPILICFFDMNQRPSRNCVRQLSRQAEELSGKDVTIAAVQASKVAENALNDWVKTNGIPFPVGIIQDGEKKTRLAWGVQSLPWLILTDRNRVVTAEGFGLDELDERISSINKK
jgi:hypothetical protein